MGGEWEYSLDGSNNATITGYNGAGGDVVIPSTVDGYTVILIDSSAFSGNDKITAVSIPSSVTDLDNGVFKDCTKLVTVDFLPGSTITLLPGEAFKGCTSLTTINIPDTVTHIGRYYSNYVFEGCTSLVTISIPDSVTHIGRDAFKDCTSLKSIVFTENSLLETFDEISTSNVVPIVTGCSSLESFYFPKLVNGAVDSSHFEGCTSLKSFTVHPDSKRFIAIDGVLYYKSSKVVDEETVYYPSTIYIYPMAKEGDDYIAPETVNHLSLGCFTQTKLVNIDLSNTKIQSISAGTFKGCSDLVTVDFPSTLTRIYPGAFEGCSSISEFVVDENSEYLSVDDGVLFNKDKTEIIRYPIAKAGSTYTLPSTVRSIAEGAFEGCTSLTKVMIGYNGNFSIGAGAFKGCSNLATIEITGSIGKVYIGSSAFDGCPDSLKKYTTNVDMVAYEDDDFKNVCDDLSSGTQYLTWHYGVYWVTYDGNGDAIVVRHDDRTVTSITVPDTINGRSVVGLGHALFKDYDKLVSIQLPNSIESIDTDVFVSCDSLKTVNIPAGVTEIPDDMFRDCISLEVITIPKGIEEIGDRAFKDCFKLKSIALPDSLRFINGYAFMNCKSLTTVTLDAEDSMLYIIYGGAFENCISLSDISLPADMGGIYSNAFKNCKSLKTFKFPSIHTISSGVLEGCTSLISVTIDEGTSVISSYVFKGCKSLTELYIPKNIQTIGLEALLGLSSLTKITVSLDNKVFLDHEGVLYRYDKNYDVYYLEHYPSMKESTTYNVIDKTHWIDNLAFINNKFLVTLNLPLCIDDIGDFVWPYGYPSLTTITVPNGNEHFVTVDGILYNEDMSILLYYPAGRTATSFTVPNTVVSIGYCSMQDCQYLENIIIPDSVKTIEVGALQNCKKLKTVIIGTGVKDVKGAAFNDSDAIESITMHIPEEGRFFKIDPDQMELWADPGIIKASNSTNLVKIEYDYWGLDEDYGVVYTVAPDTYIIEFDPNNGTGYMIPSFMEMGVPGELPENTFKRTYYEFREWNTMANGRGTSYQDQQQVVDLTTVVGGTVKLYAQWDLAEYEVTFDANGGFGEMGSQTLKCYLSTPLNENTYAYDSKTFAFWNTKADGSGITYSDKEYIIEPIDRGYDVTLYAQWVDNNMYSVIFVNNDGWPYQSETLQLGAVIEAPETDPTMPDSGNYTYTFHEWTGYKTGMTVSGNHVFFPVFIMTPIVIDEPEGDSVEIGTTEDIVDIGNILVDIEGMFDDGSIQTVDLGFGNGSIEMDSDAFASIGTSDTTAGIVEVPTSSVPDNMASKVGDRPVYDVFVGGIHEFGGDLTISFTYYLQAGESGDKLSVWHFDDNGNYVSEECTYDELTHTVTFTTDNLSYFAIMHDVDPGNGGDGPSDDPDEGGFPVWAIALIVVAVIAVAGGIGAFVFLKKKN